MSRNDSPLPLEDIQLPDGRLNNHCCRNSSHDMQVFGNSYQFNHIRRNLIEQCRFTEIHQDGICDKIGMKSFSQFCKIGHCVIKQSFKTECEDENEIVKRCNLHKFSCGLHS